MYRPWAIAMGCVTLAPPGLGADTVSGFIVLAIGALLAFGGAGAAVAADSPGFVRIAPDTMPWTPLPNTPGVKVAILAGDPSKPGPYVMRVTFPPHVMDTPHFHSSDRYVTVLKGSWYAGTGELFDPSKAVPMPPGSYMFHPAGGVHWDGSNDDHEVIVQIVGIGPVRTTQADAMAAEWVKLQP